MCCFAALGDVAGRRHRGSNSLYMHQGGWGVVGSRPNSVCSVLPSPLGTAVSGCEEALLVREVLSARQALLRGDTSRHTYKHLVVARLDTRTSQRGAAQSNLRAVFLWNISHGLLHTRNVGDRAVEHGRADLQAQPHRGAHPTRSRGGRPFARQLPSGHEGPADDQQPPVATGTEGNDLWCRSTAFLRCNQDSRPFNAQFLHLCRLCQKQHMHASTCKGSAYAMTMISTHQMGTS